MPASTFAFLLLAVAAAQSTNTSVDISKVMLTAIPVAGGMLTETAGGNDCTLPSASPPPSTGPFSRQACLDAINKYRGMKGLSSIALCSAERQTLADQMVQYDGDRHAGHEYWKKCSSPKGARGQCEAGRFGSAARAVEAYWNEGPPKKGGFNHYSIMMSTKNTCVACGFSQKNYNLGQKHQTWTYAHNFYSDGNPPSPPPSPSPAPSPSPPSPSPGISLKVWGTTKCLDLPGGDTTNGNLLWLWECDGGANQAWVFDAGSWRIIYKAEPSKCLDIPGDNIADGQRLQIWDCNGHRNQNWGYDANMKTIYSAWKNHVKCIDINWGDGSDFNTVVQLWSCNGHSNQWWYIADTNSDQANLSWKGGPTHVDSKNSSQVYSDHVSDSNQATDAFV